MQLFNVLSLRPSSQYTASILRTRRRRRRYGCPAVHASCQDVAPVHPENVDGHIGGSPPDLTVKLAGWYPSATTLPETKRLRTNRSVDRKHVPTRGALARHRTTTHRPSYLLLSWTASLLLQELARAVSLTEAMRRAGSWERKAATVVSHD